MERECTMAETRKIAAILAADVVGFSRLTGADEDRTLARLRALRSDLIDPTIAVHNGRVFKRTGDGTLAEFRSVVDAVRCAMEVQNAMIERNSGLPPERRIEFRVGIHLGDVVEESDGDLMGDGVNIAARLEGIAKPGTICLSEDAYRQVKARLNLAVTDLGPTQLKNIAEPIRAYLLEVGVPAGAKPVIQAEPAVPARLTLPDKPSIAVLPFVNLSSDPEQEYFSDGMTEDIITDLSRWASLSVTSRNSTYRFKGQPVDMQTIGRELGVRFLVEGSIRRMGERIRITAQLIDAETGNHVWAERFDRSMADLFAVQDEVVRTIVGTLVGRVYVSATERLRRAPRSNPAAYDLTLRGNWLPYDDPASRAEAKRCFEEAIELDPGYGLPHSLLALMLRGEWYRDFSGSHELLDRALALAKRGVELADNESSAHMALGYLYLDRRSFDLAIRHMERAIEINPANPWNQADFGNLLSSVGRGEEGLDRLRNARRADPYFGPSWYWPTLGRAQFVLRRYADALVDFERGAAGAADLAVMAGCCAKLGLADRARELVARCLAVQPESTVSRLVAKHIFKNASDSEHLAECLRLAGIPE
jgi:adenylate cyclase